MGTTRETAGALFRRPPRSLSLCLPRNQVRSVLPCRETGTGGAPVAAPLDAVYCAMREATVDVSMGAELILPHTEI